MMEIFEYSKSEAENRELLTKVKMILVNDLDINKQKLELINMQIRNVDRCQDAWTMETLFRRGISMDKLDSVKFGMKCMEVS